MDGLQKMPRLFGTSVVIHHARKKRKMQLRSLVWMIALTVVFLQAVRSMSKGEKRAFSSFFPSNRELNFVKSNKVTLGSRADWKNEGDVPNFCKRIIKNPSPFRKNCRRNSHNMTCSNFDNETLMFSQFQQDYYLYTRHFYKLKRRGIYLDIATNDPISISNTFFIDRCLQWSGLCVEANPEYYERIHRFRSCHLVPTCVSRRDGEVVEVGLYGGAGGILGKTNKHMEKWAKQNVSVPKLVERCTTVKAILARGNVQVVDYLSLDVEGHEVEVLKGVDWEKTKINVMSIEVSGHIEKEVDELLQEKGYVQHIPDLDEKTRRTGRLTEDVVYLHPDVEFGNPV